MEPDKDKVANTARHSTIKVISSETEPIFVIGEYRLFIKEAPFYKVYCL